MDALLQRIFSTQESACNAGDLGLIPGLGRSPGEGKGYPTPVLWSGEFHGLDSAWGRKESDMTQHLSLSLSSCSRLCPKSVISQLGLSIWNILSLE